MGSWMEGMQWLRALGGAFQLSQSRNDSCPGHLGGMGRWPLGGTHPLGKVTAPQGNKARS